MATASQKMILYRNRTTSLSNYEQYINVSYTCKHCTSKWKLLIFLLQIYLHISNRIYPAWQEFLQKQPLQGWVSHHPKLWMNKLTFSNWYVCWFIQNALAFWKWGNVMFAVWCHVFMLNRKINMSLQRFFLWISVKQGKYKSNNDDT